MAQIGTTGGTHVPNYHKDSTTGNTPHPIQAGKANGPVHFNFVNNPAHVISPGNVPSPNQNKAKTALYITQASGYGFTKG